MTGPIRGPIRGPHPDELISASLTNDLTDIERRQLDTHLADCSTCRATLEAFREQRLMVGKMRQVEPPRDLSARVRAGIETGRHAQLPWWQRTSTLLGFGASLATVAAAIMALVIIGNLRPVPDVAAASSTPVASIAPPVASAIPSADASAPPPPSATPGPIALGIPDYSLALTGPSDNLAPTVRDGATGDTITELDTIAGAPVSAVLSPNGTSLAYAIDTGLKGTTEVRVSSVIDGETYLLGESAIGGPFVEHLAWSTEGRYLAYAIADVEGQSGTNVWIFDTLLPDSPTQLTTTGNAYVGSWDLDADGELLWISLAGAEPISYAVRPIAEDGTVVTFAQGADTAVREAEGVFQPLINRDRSAVIFWRGAMELATTGAPASWLFAQDGAPYLARVSEEDVSFADAQPLFADAGEGVNLPQASLTWALDSRSFAVWEIGVGALVGSEDPSYPSPNAVYFGHLDDDRRLTRNHAIDPGDVPEGARVVDVALAASGRHLALTVAYSVGDLDAPRADLLLVTRNTGVVADDVEELAGGPAGWFGPAVYDPTALEPVP